MFATFQDLGRDMFLIGLVGSHTGTLSARVDGRALISRKGAMLGRLTADDLIEVDIGEEAPERAPEDALVHLTVYRNTDAQAVIYARPPATMALALIDDRLSPANGEGEEMLGTAPVLISQRSIGSTDMANLVSRTLRENRIVALRGQGVFARGEDLADAFRVVSLLEEMCKVAQLFRSLAREETQHGVRDWQDRRQRAGSFQPNKGRESSLGPHRGGGGHNESNVGPHRESNLGPHRDSNLGPHRDSNLGPHRNGPGPEPTHPGGRRPPRRTPNEPRHPAGGRRGMPHR